MITMNDIARLFSEFAFEFCDKCLEEYVDCRAEYQMPCRRETAWIMFQIAAEIIEKGER